ncbi:MAG: hypothetical protein ACK50O_10710 [Pirellulaceae bacterium]
MESPLTGKIHHLAMAAPAGERTQRSTIWRWRECANGPNAARRGRWSLPARARAPIGRWGLPQASEHTIHHLAMVANALT